MFLNGKTKGVTIFALCLAFLFTVHETVKQSFESSTALISGRRDNFIRCRVFLLFDK